MSQPKRPLSIGVLAGAALAIGALSCGEVPTLPDGIAYISSVVLPSPAVAFGDTLRDSTGRATPLRVYGIGIKGDTIAGVAPSFVVMTVPGKGVKVSSAGFVVGDSLRTVQIVGRVGDRLQTPPAQLDVVLQPDSISPTTTARSTLDTNATGQIFSITNPLSVTVSTGATTPRSGVKSIIVRFAVSRLFPATSAFPDTALVLLDESSRFRGPTGRTSVDTTDGSGVASRRLRGIRALSDSVEVTASATNLKGVALRGSPVRFIVITR